MANRNVTVVSYQSQFKDQVSFKERLLICGIKKSPNKKNRFVGKRERDLLHPSLYGSKITLV